MWRHARVVGEEVASIPSSKAYVGVGANLGRRRETIEAALELLAAEPDVEIRAVSSICETDPIGYEEQPRFLNGALELETSLSARQLLKRLLAIEARLGRVPGARPPLGPGALH